MTIEPAVNRPPSFARAKLIIGDVLRRHMLHPDDFYGLDRTPHLVLARRDAAKKLIELGLSATQVGILLRRNHTTILNYLPKLKEKKLARYATRRVMRHLPMELRQVVHEFAKAEGITEELLIAQWVAERARYEAEAKARAA